MNTFYIIATNIVTNKTFNLAIFGTREDAEQFIEICPVWESEGREYLLTVEGV